MLRAKIVLAASAGLANQAIARRLDAAVNTVREWRARFGAEGLAGLVDRPRSGRPRSHPAAVVAYAKAIACELPATKGVPLGRWSLAELREELLASGMVDDVSVSTLWRWLAADAIKPWQHRSWIFPRDPDFAAKAGRVLDLYERRLEDRKLQPGEFVVSADEKTSIQARCRCHRTLPPGKARTMRVNYDYDRGGALDYLAAYDVARACVFGRCAPSTGIKPFMALIEHVMTQQPYASAKRVFWIVDNGSSHRGQAAIDRLAKRFPNAVMIHTPVHASWLNLVSVNWPSWTSVEEAWV